MAVTMEKINYKGWPNSYRLANDVVELVVTTDVGPRIIRFGFIDSDNEFKEYAETLGKVGGAEWRNYGGHRLWHAPEDRTRTYYPDNEPVDVEPLDDNGLRLLQPTEATTGIQKEIVLRLMPDRPSVKVMHRFHNRNVWDLELAMWALSVMAPGGKAILPLPPRGSHKEHLLPTTTLAVWPYTDMSDPRWTWGRQYILLQQETGQSAPQKVGLFSTDGWLGYARNGHLFVKTFVPTPDVTYPDLGCNVEIFTDGQMLELETLGPLVRLQAGASLVHEEEWHLFDNVTVPDDDAGVAAHILPLIEKLDLRPRLERAPADEQGQPGA